MNTARIIQLTTAGAVLLASALPLQSAFAQTTPVEQPDKYTWLEDIHGARSMAWVKQENARTAAVLEKDPHFATFEAEALKVLESPDRLSIPQFRGHQAYNTWRDAQHMRGIVRRTSLADYLTADPHWQTILDYDALAKQDHQSWVGHGIDCLHPQDEVCMVSLSAGGEDADTLREINLSTGQFVKGGFVLPRGKQRIAWLDKDTLLIGRDWGAGTMSQAGYPITVREWKRGTPLESSKEVFRGEVTDNGYGDNPFTLTDGQGHTAALIERNRSTFAHDYYLLLSSSPKKLALPEKSSIEALLDGQLIVSLDQDWTPAGTKLSQGSVVAIDLAAATKDPAHLKPTVIFAPTSQEFSQELDATKNHLLMTTLDHVQGRAYVYTRQANGSWTRKQLPIPSNQTVGIVTTSRVNDDFFLELTGFLNPPSLWLGNAGNGSFKQAKEQKPLFDASDLTVDQLQATSKDGTKVPYFVVHKKGMVYNGANPTLMTAYGGFQVSETPTYNGVNGKVWFDRGGVYVLANIRGGGEFGPAWHEAGLKTHRQRIYDDFYAVAQDLITRKITSSQKLGIMGGSNGGLLMGVEFTQHPQMWKAVIIAVPLLDMLRFEHLSAGASWVGEYGSVSVPAERAFLASISPYNQLKPGVHYPEPLIFTTTKDDRVGPVHARKFAARMEEFHEPFYYDEITEGGHGVGADMKEEARSRAEFFTYLARKLMQ